MNLHYKISEEDYVMFNLYHFEHSKLAHNLKNKNLKTFIVSFLTAFGAMLLLCKYLTISQIWAAAIGCLIIGIVSAVFYWLVYDRIIKNRIVKESKQCSKDFIGEFEMILGKKSIKVIGNEEVRETNYEKIIKIERDEKRVYIYIGDIIAYIVPADVLEGDEAKQLILQELQSRVGIAIPILKSL